MRTLRKVRKLSHDTFVESYGIMSRSKSVDGRATKKRNKNEETEMYGTFRPRRESLSSLDDGYQDPKSDNSDYKLDNANNNNNTTVSESGSLNQQPLTDDETLSGNFNFNEPQKAALFKGPANRRLRRFSLKKFPSTGDIHKAVTRRTKSDGNENSKDEELPNSPSNSFLSSWHSQFSLHRLKAASPAARGISPKRSLFRIPASNMGGASHSGYLDRRNKKRKWEKYWCVIQDSCLYCYNSPQSEYTQDAIVLKGYFVSADISDVQRAKFTFKLEKTNSQTFHFRCDNHKGFMQWICTIKKESSDAAEDLSDNEILMNSVKNSADPMSRPRRTPPIPLVSSSPCVTSPVSPSSNPRLRNRRHTADNLFKMTRREHLDLELQKEKLLREVLEQQKEIILERNNMMPPPSQQNQPYYVPLERDSPKPTRNEVMEKYERVKESHEIKILKSLTQLQRRRNSVQLKIDQLTREAKPKSRRSRSTSRHIIQSMEARLALLQSELAEIDQDIREQQVSKEDLIENLIHKRDLEIMVLDQRESLDIVKRQQRTNSVYQERGRRTNRRFSNTPATSYSHEHLTSIDETSAISDTSSTSSGSSSCFRQRNGSPDGVISSTPRHLKLRNPLEDLSLKDNEQLERMQDFCGSCQNIRMSKASSFSSDADEVMSQGNDSVEGALSDDFRSLSTSSYSDLDGDHMTRTRASSSDESLGKKSTEIRPDVLAEIEEFEVFSKMMLQRINSTQC